MASEPPDGGPLEQYCIASVPQSMYYIHDFLSPAECSALLAKIPAHRWTSLSKRRLQAHPSQLTQSQTLLPGPLPPWLADAPAPILQRFAALGVFRGSGDDTQMEQQQQQQQPNHVLVNEYSPGQGIMPHEDGGAYWPVVATISLGGALVLDLYDKKQPGEESQTPATAMSSSEPRHRIFQEPGSLLITRGDAYGCMLHGISEIDIDENLNAATVANWELLGDRDALMAGSSVRCVRVSLTYRIVRKVSKINMKMLGVAGRR